ncbi:TM2 domain-containing protein [Mycolicibacterium mageritense]|uniref:TM2 domain-containing protein n=1 Tax=Mycolicibacterium mageritense TaxID=53462 RepID=UPI0011DB2D10|nr:TM2 domain-containing protein [Mycolicibacterium mageritense]TXI62205.1 MAG: TM2 domain-containing protein [Mycolicibacterium mageritense]
MPDQLTSDDPPKSAVAAGLLQLFFGFLGLGRFYLGYTGIGMTQLGLWIVGLLMLFLGWLLLFVFSIIGFMILIALGIWVLIEAIMMIAGAIPDADGRRLV